MAQPQPKSQSTVLSPSRAHHLATANILTIFSNKDPKSRLAAMPDIYASDIVVYEPDGAVLHGHEGVNNQVSNLLAEREGWAFTVTGEVKHNQDFVGVTWGFGPQGDDGKVDVKATGSDAIIVEKGEDGEVRIKTLYVIIDGLADAKA